MHGLFWVYFLLSLCKGKLSNGYTKTRLYRNVFLKIPDEFEGTCSPPIDNYVYYKFANEIF